MKQKMWRRENSFSWSCRTEVQQWKKLTGLASLDFALGKHFGTPLPLSAISLAVNTPCSAPPAENYFENTLSISQSILSSIINQHRLFYQTQGKCDLNWCWRRSGGEMAESGEEFVCFFYCVTMNPLKRGRCSFNNKKKKRKEERKKKRKKGASVVSAADQQRSSREL